MNIYTKENIHMRYNYPIESSTSFVWNHQVKLVLNVETYRGCAYNVDYRNPKLQLFNTKLAYSRTAGFSYGIRHVFIVIQ